MIKDNIDKLILEAAKSRDKVRLESLRAIKAAIINFETAKNAKPLDDAGEVGIIRKLVEQREEDAKTYRGAGREELALAEEAQANVIKEFLPAPITKEAIEEEFSRIAESGVELVKKNMGLLIKSIKEKYPTADGKLVSQVVMSHLS